MSTVNTTTSDRELELVVHPSRLCDLLGISRGTLRRWVREGQFPKPIKLGRRRVAWSRSAVLTWIANQERSR